MIFSISAFIIALRETMEAALIISIILAYLSKTGNQIRKKDVWIGVLLAIIASIITAILFQIFVGGLEGRTEKIFEGFAYSITAVFLSWMIIFMFKAGKNMSTELQLKVDDITLDKSSRYGIFLLAFFNVFREGAETVIFFYGIGAKDEPVSIFASGMLGIVVSLILAVFLFRGSLNLDLHKFFNITSIVLILFAAGLFARGMHEFQEIGVFGPESAFANIVFLDLSNILNDKTNYFGVMLRALFGYQDTPTWLELFAYIFYWIFISLFFIKIKNEKNVVAIPN